MEHLILRIALFSVFLKLLSDSFVSMKRTVAGYSVEIPPKLLNQLGNKKAFLLAVMSETLSGYCLTDFMTISVSNIPKITGVTPKLILLTATQSSVVVVLNETLLSRPFCLYNGIASESTLLNQTAAICTFNIVKNSSYIYFNLALGETHILLPEVQILLVPPPSIALDSSIILSALPLQVWVKNWGNFLNYSSLFLKIYTKCPKSAVVSTCTLVSTIKGAGLIRKYICNFPNVYVKFKLRFNLFSSIDCR